MVASGLTQRIEVSQYRLATHLVLALVIFAAIVWTLRRMARAAAVVAPSRLKITSRILLAVTFLQIYFGALVAGLRAGRALQHLAWYRRRVHSLRRAAVLRDAVVAQPVRQYAHRAVRASHDGLCAVRAGGVARARCAAHRGTSRAVTAGAVAACRCSAAGYARHPHAAQPGADRSCAVASGRCDRRADACDHADGAAVPAADRAHLARNWLGQSGSVSNSRRRRKRRAGARNIPYGPP